MRRGRLKIEREELLGCAPDLYPGPDLNTLSFPPHHVP